MPDNTVFQSYLTLPFRYLYKDVPIVTRVKIACESPSGGDDLILKVAGLTKIYIPSTCSGLPRLAVDDIYFGLQRGEVSLAGDDVSVK